MPNAALIDAELVPSGTVLTQKGDSPAVDISLSGSRAFLLTLKVTEVVEQEYIELWLIASPDGTTWATRPIASLPQRFYVGEYPTLIDLSADPNVKFLRVHWELSRWGRGELAPRVACGLTLREVSRETIAQSSKKT